MCQSRSTDQCCPEVYVFVDNLPGGGEALVSRLVDDEPLDVAAVGDAQRLPIRAVHLFGATEVLWEDPGLPIPPTMRIGYEHSAAIARTQINETAFVAAWAEGQTMTLEQSLEYARVTAQT